MKDPDPKNPNSVPPLRGSDDVIKSKRVTRSSSMDGKLALNYTFSISKPTFDSGKKGSKKGSIMGRDLKKELDDMEYDDDVSNDLEVKDEDMEVRDDDIDVNAKESMVSNVSQGSGDRNDEKLEKLSNVNKVSDDMPIPFSENVILNHGGNKTSVVRNAGSLGKDSEERVNNVWPKLNEINNKGSGGNGNGRNVGDIDMPDGTNGRKPLSFISAIQGISFSGSNKLSRIPMRMKDKGENVADMDPVIEEGSKRWDITLVGYFVGLKLSYYEISGHLRRMWRSYHLTEIITNDSVLYFLKFRLEEELNFVLENGPWLVDGKPLFVQEWEAGLCMDKPKPARVPLWVKFMNVPLKAGNTHGISRITSCIGNPIIMDRITMSICVKAYCRASFARVLIEVDASKELADNIKGCKNREMTEEEKDEFAKSKMHNMSRATKSNTKENEEWQDVRRPSRNGASTSKNGGQQSNVYVFGYRGGFNGRGRGGMNGRGGMSGKGGVYQRTNMEGNNKKYVSVKNVQRVDKVQVMNEKSADVMKDKGKNVADSIKGGGLTVKDKNVMNVKNSFSVLSDETVEIGGDEWVLMKGKIDLAYKCKAKANMVEALTWQISKLQKDIQHCHQNIAMVANDGAKKQCVWIMKKEGITRNQAFLKQKAEVELFFYTERELTEEIRGTWTDEIVVQYETLVGEKVDSMVRVSFDQSVKDYMEEEVAKDTSGNARFITRDETSNVVDEVDTQMQGNIASLFSPV
ncbi:zinc knuckle CX2CX4HX4C containing protein [Tanacetum coccineum]